MRFTLSSSVLNSQLQTLSRVINSKNSLPILDCILFEVADGKLTLTASDKSLVTEIQTVYAGLNSYQKSLLSAKELATLNALAAIDADALATVATVNLVLSESGTFPHNTSDGT